MKKIVFLTTRIFWPTDSGRKVSLYHYCKGLHDECEYDIYVYSFLEAGQSEKSIESQPYFIKDIKLAKPLSKLKKLSNLIFKSAIFYQPFQNALYSSRQNLRSFKKYVETVNPDMVIVDMIRLAPYLSALKNYKGMKVLDLDDMLSKRYSRQANVKNSKSQLLGAYSQDKNGFINNSFIKRIILKSESKRVRKAEIKYGRKYDKVVFVSDNETKEFNQLIGQNKAVTIRLGVDYEYLSKKTDIQTEFGSITFMGNLKVAANLDSLLFIINNILPNISCDYKFYIIGSVSEEIINKYQSEQIIFCGLVEDIRPTIKKSQLFLSPILYGSGIKTKILEAMAIGVTVVTNSIGAEGIEVDSGESLFVSDNVDTIIQLTTDIIMGRIETNEVIKNAQVLIKEKYDWKIIYKSLYELEKI